MEARTYEQLHSILWRKLPFELVEKILVKLPFSSLVRFRTVCKKWKTSIASREVAPQSDKPVLLLHHPGLLSDRLEEPSDPLPAYIDVPRDARLYFHNSHTNEWKDHLFPPGFAGNGSLLAADGGLLCFGLETQPEKFHVYNPLSKQSRELTLPLNLPSESSVPPFLHVLVGLKLDRSSGDYRLLVASLQPDDSSSLIYNSRSKSWDVHHPIPTRKTNAGESCWQCHSRAVHLGQSMYWLISMVDGRCDIRVAVVKYDTGLDLWTVARLSKPTITGSYLHLVSHNGNLEFLTWEDSRYWEGVGTMDLEQLGPDIKLMDSKWVSLHYEEQVMEEGVYRPFLDHEEQVFRPFEEQVFRPFLDDQEQAFRPLWGVGIGKCLYIVCRMIIHGDEMWRGEQYKVLRYDSNGEGVGLDWVPHLKHMDVLMRLCRFDPLRNVCAFSPSLRAFV